MRRQGPAGREREVRAAAAALDATFDGRGGALCLAGEPGIGKTTLLDALAADATDRGGLVLRGRGWEGGGAPPYFPWINVVRDALAAAGDRLARSQPPLFDVVARLVAPGATRSMADETDPFAVYDAVWSLLHAAAERRPVVIVVDDVHAADDASVGLLRYVAREAKRANVLVAVAHRRREAAARPPVAAVLAELGREGSSLELGAVDVTTARGIVADAAGTTAAEVPLPVAEQIHDKADGNPFFIRQLGQLWATSGRVEGVGVPEGVRSVIRRRLEGLSEETRSFLELVAVVGRDVDVERLQIGAGLDVEATLRQLEEAIAAGVLERRADGHYGFVHALLQETIYEDITDGRRRRMHRGIGEAMLERLGAVRDERLAEIAHHHVEAVPLVDPARAVDLLVRAGEAATAAVAHTEAIAHFRRALGLVSQHHLDVDPLPLWVRLVEICDAQSLREDAIAAALTATDLARTRGDWASFARAAVAAGGNPDMFAIDTRLSPLYEELLERLAPADPMYGRVCGRLAMELPPQLEARRIALAQEAVDIATASGSPMELLDALRALSEATVVVATPEQRIDMGERMAAAGRAVGRVNQEANGLSTRAIGELCAGRRADADASFERHAALASTVVTPYLAHMVTNVLQAMLALLDGRWDDADRHQRIAYEWGWERLGRVNALMASFVIEITALYERGRLDEAKARTELVRQLAPDLVHWRILASFFAVLDGSPPDAEHLRGHARGRFRAVPRDGTWLLLLTYFVEIAYEVGDPESAGVLDELFAPFAGQVVFCGQSTAGPICSGSADRFRGMLAATQGDLDAAVERLEAGLEMNDSVGARPELVRNRHYLAHVLLRRGAPGDAERAEALRAAGLALASHLAMPVWEAKLASLSTPGSRPATPAPEDEAEAASFRREGPVWAATFRGRTTRVKDSTGVRYLARLLDEPGREIAAVEIASVAVVQGDAGAALDRRAVDEYRRRIVELQADVADAESSHDLLRAERAREELDALVDELSGAVGLGGRARPTGSNAERARSAVTKAIRSAVRRVADADPSLGAYLAATVRTGTFCSFTPGLAGEPVAWEVDQQAAISRQ